MEQNNNFEINEEVLNRIAEIYHLKPKNLKTIIASLNEKELFINEAAIVLSVDPLLIAIDQSLFDSAAIYEYPSFLVEMFDLKVGTHLSSKNIYGVSKKPALNAYNQLIDVSKINDVNPYILDFFISGFDSKILPFSEYHYEILKNKALFLLKIEGYYFDGITRRIGGTKDDFRW